jgi:hypothetical protein
MWPWFYTYTVNAKSYVRYLLQTGHSLSLYNVAAAEQIGQATIHALGMHSGKALLTNPVCMLCGIIYMV